MAKTTHTKLPPPVAPEIEEDPIWGDAFGGLFSDDRLIKPPATPSGTDEKPIPKTPARKRQKDA